MVSRWIFFFRCNCGSYMMMTMGISRRSILRRSFISKRVLSSADRSRTSSGASLLGMCMCWPSSSASMCSMSLFSSRVALISWSEFVMVGDARKRQF